MTTIEIIKRLFRDYTKNYVNKILLSVFFSLLVAASTSSIAWLLDPAIEKIFIQKNQTLILIIPAFIILAFTTKGVSLYLAKVIMIGVAEDALFPMALIESQMLTLYNPNLSKTTFFALWPR